MTQSTPEAKERFKKFLERNDGNFIRKNLAKIGFILHHFLTNDKEGMKLEPDVIYTLQEVHDLFDESENRTVLDSARTDLSTANGN